MWEMQFMQPLMARVSVDASAKHEGPQAKRKTRPKQKFDVTSKFPVGDISLAILIRTDATQPKGGKGTR